MNLFKYEREISEEEMINYYKIEQQTQEYAHDFFDSLSSLRNYADNLGIQTYILPLVCYNSMFDVNMSLESGSSDMIAGRFVPGDNPRQGALYFGVNCSKDSIGNKDRQSIKHEILHYTLWALDFPWNDDDLEFWCVAYAFNARPYKPLYDEAQEKFDVFKRIFDERYDKFRRCSFICDILSELLPETDLDVDEWENILVQIADEYDKEYNNEEYKERLSKRRVFQIDSYVYGDEKDELKEDLSSFLDDFLGDIEYQIVLNFEEIESDSDEIDEDDEDDDSDQSLAHVKVIIWDEVDEDGLKEGLSRFAYSR